VAANSALVVLPEFRGRFEVSDQTSAEFIDRLVIQSARYLPEFLWSAARSQREVFSLLIDQSGWLALGLDELWPILRAPPKDDPAKLYSSNAIMDSADSLRFDDVLARLGGDRQLLGELVEIYFEDSPELIARIRQSIGDSDATALTKAAHDLKGLLSNFATSGATATALSLERAGRGRQLEDAPRHLLQLEGELRQVDETLRHWTESEKPSAI
jgi:HPt (histidine-containing phosphotransfer) domain-containing protein